MGNFLPVFVYAGIGLLGLIIIGFIFSRMYVKASAELAFVRTGLWGKKVCKEGGMIVIPVMQQIVWVRLSTLKLVVGKKNEEGLITKDRLRVDVSAIFYMRVQPEKDSIAMAAQTLGNRTQNTDSLKELIEGKFVDGLRAVAMEMEMADLFEKRADFVLNVQDKLKEGLKKNGLELETVTLTSLDQTRREFFNENNINDAEGLTKITEIVEERKKRRNELEKENTVLIERKNFETEKQSLEIERDVKYAKLEQEKEIANRTATENASKAKIIAEQNQLANEAQVISEREIKTAQIQASQSLEVTNLQKEQAVKEANINKEKAIELANQQRDIDIAKKSEEKSLADQKANEARALSVAAEEKVVTSRVTEVANREKAITIIKAEEESGSQAAKVKVIAQAEKEAAKDRAEAVITEAEAKAKAIMIEAEADKKRYQVEAEGKEQLNKAENELDDRIIDMRIRSEIIKNLRAIIEASVKPIEQISDFKVINVTGLTGNGSEGTTKIGGNGSDSLVNQLLQYRAQAPIIDDLLKQAGLGNNLTEVIEKATGNNKEMIPVKSEEKSPNIEVEL